MRFNPRFIARPAGGPVRERPYFISETVTKFAWLPKRMSAGLWIWLEAYRVSRP